MKFLSNLISVFAVCGLLVSSGAVQAASPVLLSWSFGNQICRTDLNVTNDGSVSHKKICPVASPPVTEIPESSLSGAEIAALTDLISKAATGKSKTVPAQAALGSSAGKLSGFTANGKKEVIL